jgi:hypothetical protein
MASYLPPTESLPIFDNTVFDSNNTSYLTYTTAKKLFVAFPTAQGTSTIADFIAGTISYLTPASGSFFNIGTNQVSGGTIQIGPTGVSGVSVHAGNIDCTNNQINNATDSALNNVSLGNLQTSGVLNIGTGSRIISSGNGGAINIGTGSGAIANPVNIGGSGTVTTFGGSVSIPSLSLTNALTLPTTPPTLTTSNLGYSYNFPSVSVSGSASGTYYLYSPATNTSGAGNYLNAGVYLVTVTTQVYELNTPVAGVATYTLGVCYGTTTGLLSTSLQYGVPTTLSKAPVYVRTGTGNVRIGNTLTGTFTLTSANFVNIQVYTSIGTTFSSGNFLEILDGTIIRIA